MVLAVRRMNRLWPAAKGHRAVRPVPAIVVRLLVIVVALAALFVAGESLFGAEPGEWRTLFAVVTFGCSVLLLWLQQAYLSARARAVEHGRKRKSAEANLREFQGQLRASEKDRETLRRQVEALTATREISRAASVHMTFSDVTDEIAGVARDLAGAEDFLVFLPAPDGSLPIPRAYCRLTQATELHFTITEEGGLRLREEMAATELERVQPEQLRATRIGAVSRGAYIEAKGLVRHRSLPVGTVRVDLMGVDPKSSPRPTMIRQLVAGELGAARIDLGQVREALQYRHPVAYDGSTRRAELACALLAEEESPGVLKARFRIGPEEDLEKALREREALLQEAAHHIARAVRNDRLYDEATKDALTGLFNKRYMMGQLEKMLQLARRGNPGLALLLIDLDHFKQVNDRYGHLTGDMILRDAGALVQQIIRRCDLACRYGGEEIAVILPKGGLHGAEILAGRLQTGIDAKDFFANSGEPVPLTASVGFAAFDETIRTTEDLIARADAALYEAKRTGRNRAVAWTPTMEVPDAVREAQVLPREARA